MRAGTVYIVGTGPGDPSLISVRGRRYLSAAEVVVYDRLVHPRLLALAPAGAERLDVGAAAPQPLAQDAINLLLAEKAREDKIVVRLKWGDPFVFDSGGKEALFLHEQRIPFEVVPGATAPVAWPGYAGIPVTYPGAGDTLVFVRGYEDGSQKPVKVDWSAIAALRGTMVCYAGAKQIPAVVEALLAHGADPEEWAAVVHNGTLPGQQTLQRTLSELAQVLKREPVREPGILIVGPAVGLRDHLRWFDERPLFGRRILVTRAREQASDLLDQLEDLGAEVIEAPSTRIAPPGDFSALDDACATAGTYGWIVFTTANSVDALLRRLLEGPYDVRAIAGPRICAIGPATADRLSRLGIKADLSPVESGIDAILGAMNALRPLANARVLLPRAEGAREMMADELRKAGAVVTEVTAYRAIPQHLHADAE
jgi:uroporphyrinogen III methyltransferase/synthase